MEPKSPKGSPKAPESFESVTNLEVFYSIIAYLDEDTIRQLPITTKQLLESKRTAEETQLYWKEKTELMFETPIHIDRNVDWKKIYTLLYQSYEKGKRANPRFKTATPKRYPLNSMFIAAGQEGNFDALEVLHIAYRNYNKIIISKLMSEAFHAAGSNGYFDLIKLMIQNKYVLPSKSVEEDGMNGMETNLSVSLVQMVGYLGDEAIQVLDSVKDFYSARELKDAIAKCNEFKIKIDRHVGLTLPSRRIDWEKAFRFIKYKTGIDYGRGGIIPHVLLTSATRSGDVNIFNLAVDIILLQYDLNILKELTRQIDLNKVTNAIRERIIELERE